MSSGKKWYRGPRINPENEFETHEAFIVSILHVQNPVLRSLAAHFHTAYFDTSQGSGGNLMAIDEAKRVWRQDPRKIDHSEQKENEQGAHNDLAGALEDEMPDIDAYISEVMLQESQAFNADQHDWYKRHERALSVRAVVLVRYGANQARVIGDFCTLSRAVRLHIKGKIEERDGGMPVVDASSKAAGHGIELTRVDSISGASFFELLVEKGMHRNEARVHVQNFFATPSASLAGRAGASVPPPVQQRAPSYLEPTVMANRTAYRNAAVVQAARESVSSMAFDGEMEASGDFQRVTEARQRAQDAALSNQVTIEDLWKRIIDSKIDPKKFLETEFISLGLRMVLLSPELDEIRDMYESREVQLNAVARGVDYIRLLSRLMRSEPEILCFGKLRRLYGEAHSMRSLSLLPDLSYDSYRRLVVKYRGFIVDDPVKAAAIDIYGNIMRQDVYGNGRPPTEKSYTSGNMYTVFGMHEEDRTVSYYHAGAQPDPPTALHEQDARASCGRFALPDDKDRPVNADTRLLLMADIERLRHACSTDDFVRALHWMVDKGIIVRERFIGTGRHNRGKQVDAFFIAEVHEAQKRVVDTLVDIYRRGVKQSMHHSPTMLAGKWHVSLFQQFCETRKKWREEYLPAVHETQRQRALAREAAQRAAGAAAVVEDNDEDSGANELLQAAQTIVSNVASAEAAANEEDDVNRSPVAQLARKIARRLQWFETEYKSVCEEELIYNDADDAYKDARQGRLLQRPALMLMRRPRMVLDNGKMFADEQITAIRRMLVSPLSLLVGRGGVGKSETLSYVCKQYPPEQIMCVAFTSQVASMLSKRTGFHASTIHSVLFQHARYMEALYRARAYRKHTVERRNAPPESRGEAFNYEAVMACRSDRELRAYVEHQIEAHPPFSSPFENTRVIITDEMSLVELPLFLRLIEAAHNPAQGRFVERLIMVGDLDQLPPIGYGNVQSDIAHGLPHAVSQLTTNHRSLGTQLFTLAQAIAEHQPVMPMPKFDFVNAMRSLRDPQGGDIVAINTMQHDLPDRLACVIETLGAIDNEEIRRSIQCIATTNEEVKTANALMRWLYFGKRRGQAQQSAVQVIRTKKRRNEDDDDDEVDDEKAREAAERERVEAQLNMRVMVGDRIYLTKNSRIVFKPRTDDEPQREKRFYNSRLLEAMQFYNAPKTLTARLYCRCGMCGPRPQDAPAGYRAPCMDRLDLVPPLRCRRLERDEVDSSHWFEWADHKMPHKNEPTRRIAVFRDESGEFIELDVGRMLHPRSRFQHGYALTTHKMQGAQQRIIIYICTKAPCFINWKYLYTAVTRAQCRVILLSSDEVFKQLVHRKEPVRRSMMWHKLFEEIVGVLNDYPNSECATIARDTCPQILAEHATIDWNVFENARYRTDNVASRAEEEQLDPADDFDEEAARVLRRMNKRART